jgi:CRISPR/Cas system-associated endonuclease Cas1
LYPSCARDAPSQRCETPTSQRTATGYFHAPACDLAEPARPRVDAFVHRLFAEAILRAEDFSGRGEDGCTMGKSGRRAFYRGFAESCAPALRETLAVAARDLAAGLTERAAQRRAAGTLTGAAQCDRRLDGDPF